MNHSPTTEGPTIDHARAQLSALGGQFRAILGEELKSLSAADQVVLLTQALHDLFEIREWITEQRKDAVFRVYTEDNGGESLASVARRAGVSHQALSRIAMQEKAERGEL